MAFSGFPAEAFDFYRRLEADNSREFWQANKATYEAKVKAPLLAFTELAPAELQPFRLFRPNRDVRFSKDKSPYKTNVAAYGEHEGGCGFYLGLSADALTVGCGIWHMAADQLERFREAVADDATGAPLAGLMAGLERRGVRAASIEELKTAPRGYPKDHPRVTLLRRKGFAVLRDWEPAAWMHTKAAAKKLTDTWAAMEPARAWLDAHVGPSELAPDDDRWTR